MAGRPCLRVLSRVQSICPRFILLITRYEGVGVAGNAVSVGFIHVQEHLSQVLLYDRAV